MASASSVSETVASPATNAGRATASSWISRSARSRSLTSQRPGEPSCARACSARLAICSTTSASSSVRSAGGSSLAGSPRAPSREVAGPQVRAREQRPSRGDREEVGEPLGLAPTMSAARRGGSAPAAADDGRRCRRRCAAAPHAAAARAGSSVGGSHRSRPGDRASSVHPGGRAGPLPRRPGDE